MFNLKSIGFFATSAILAGSFAIATSATAIHALPNEDLSFELLKEINTSGADSNLQTLAVVGGTSYFSANDGIHGLELWKSDGTANGTSLVKDIYAGGMSGNPNSAVVIGGTLYFAATDYAHGWELWKSDGTEAGTVLVKDIRPGTYGAGAGGLSSVVANLVVIANTVYFTAQDATQESELWKSDGTESGTTLVRDIPGNVGGSSPQNKVVIGSTVYFNASDPMHGSELWKSDGTEIGTVLVKDINPGTGSSKSDDPTAIMQVVGNTIYFRANDGVHGYELWKSDGTEQGTVLVKDIRVGINESALRELTSIGNTLYFSANDYTRGTELWKSDGTEQGTVLVKDINTGSNPFIQFNTSSTPTNLTDSGGVLYFRANDWTHGAELWKSDGTEIGTVLVKDINSGTGSSKPTNLRSVASITTIAGTIYFSADDGVHGFELWKSDGTAGGTTLVKDIQSGVSGSSPDYPVVIGGTLYFRADDATHGIELWKSDGTAGGTTLVKDIHAATDSSDVSDVVIMGDYFYFIAQDGIHGYDLWKSNGTPEGTVLLKDFEPASVGRAGALMVVGNTLYFGNIDSTHGLELWRSDGTSAGTDIVKDINPGTGWGWPQYMTAIGDILYFIANDGVHGNELWKSNGTSEGTTLVKDINPGTSSSGYPPAVIGDILYFIANDGIHGNELWKSNGTPEGTTLVKDINPGAASSNAYAVAVGNTLFINADDGIHGYELWKSNGTPESTTLVKDIKIGPDDTYLDRLTVVGNVLFFTTDDGIHGNELWKSNGTPEGTTLVKDINPDPNGWYPDSLVPFGNTLFFIADDGVHGLELWKSDGTEGGTLLVKDVYPGIGGSPDEGQGAYPDGLTVIGNKLYFSDNDTTHGIELWQSDGTGSGTSLVDDIRTGELGSTPHQMFGFKNKILLVADDGVHGDEFWIASQPTAPPSAPQNLSAVAGNQSVSVSFTAPSSNGGTAITNYKYQINDGPWQTRNPASTASPLEISGLTNGVPASIKLRAANTSVDGTESSSVTATPKTVPGAPRNLSAVVGNGAATVAFSAPISNGGATISQYVATATPPSGAALICRAASTSCEFTNLVNNVEYDVQVYATNQAGSGANSNSINIFPAAPPSVTALNALPETLILTNTSFTPGERLVLTYSGFTPSEWVVVSLQSTPTVLNSIQADANGVVTTSVVLPSSTAPGSHTLSLLGLTSGVGARKTVTVKTASQNSFVSLSEPKRLVDTRGGNRFGTTSTSGVSIKRIKITGATTYKGETTGLPDSNIGAVALNVTAVGGIDDKGYGFVTVYPCDSPSTRVPDSSNLNFSGGQTIPNAVIAPVSTNGYICFSVNGNTDLLVDAAGYFPANSGFSALSEPKRLVDTRGGNRFGTTSTSGVSIKRIKITGATTYKGETTGLPDSNIGAVALNVTAVGGIDDKGYGFVTVYPCDSPSTRVPDSSNLNFSGGQTIPNAVIAPVSTNGYICFSVNGNTDLLVDAAGYFPANSGFSALTEPKRLVDTRGGNRFGTTSTSGVSIKRIKITDAKTYKGETTGLPDTNIGAVALNVTAVGGIDDKGYGFVTVYPCDSISTPVPNSSNLNFSGGQTIPNAVIAPVSTNGYICFSVNGNTDLLVDAAGYFPANP